MKNSKSLKKLEEISALLQKANSFQTKKFLNHAEKLKISKITLRRYLHQLEELGYLELSYGNIEVIRKDLFKIDQQSKQQLDKYKNIAVQANLLLADEDNIFVSGGKTMEMFVKNINVNLNLLCTNSLAITLFAINNNYIKEIILIGGRISREKKSCVGLIARNMIDKLNFNHVFTSFDSYDNHLIYLNNINDNNIIKHAIKRTKKINVFGTQEKRFNQGVVELIKITETDNFIIV